MPANDQNPVKSTDRTLSVLEALAAEKEPIGLAELVRLLGIPKSSLHSIIRTMIWRGWVNSDPLTGGLSLGPRVLILRSAHIESDSLVKVVAPTLDALAGALGETVHLGSLDGADVVYLDKRESIHPLRLYSAVGKSLPAHATALGKAILSQLAESAVQKLIKEPLQKLTENTISNWEDLRVELERTRTQGYAIDNEENAAGITCFAVPLRSKGQVTNALSVSIPTSRLTDELKARTIEQLMRAQESIHTA